MTGQSLRSLRDRAERAKGLESAEEGQALFTLLGRALYGVPDRELIGRLADDRVFYGIPFIDEGSASVERRLLIDWTDGCGTPFSEEDFEQVQVDYGRLFVGTKKVLAPLWESVYFNKDRMVFQRQTFEVRKAYAKYGLQVESFSHEPDDHLAYELLFVARLFEVNVERAQVGDWERSDEVLHDLCDFVEAHPRKWVPRWCEKVQKSARTDFYRGLSLLVLHSLEQVPSFVDRLLEPANA